MIIYHITTQSAWDQAKVAGQYTTASLTSEGFIHLSTIDQVVGTANLLFRGQPGLLLLTVDTEKLTSTLRFDPASSHGAVQEFPHVYGPLNISAVIEVLEFNPKPDGSFDLPPQLTRRF